MAEVEEAAMAPWSVLDGLELVASSRDQATDLEHLLRRLTATARDTIPRADSASVVVCYEDGELESFAATEPAVVAADHLQCEVREGPVIDAVTLGELAHTGDLARDARWPSYRASASALGLRSQLSMRVHDGKRARIALTLYSRDRAAFRHPSEAAGVLLAYARNVLGSLGDVTRVRRALVGCPDAWSLGSGDGSGDRMLVTATPVRPNLRLVAPTERVGRSTYDEMSRSFGDGSGWGTGR